MKCTHTNVWVLLGVVCLVVGGCVARVGSGAAGIGRGLGKLAGSIARSGSNSSVTESPEVPPGIHERPPGAPPPVTYPGTTWTRGSGPPPPYPGLSYGPPPYPGLTGYPGGYQRTNSGQDFVSGTVVAHSLSNLSRDKSYYHYYYPHYMIHHSQTRPSYDAVRYTDEHGVLSFNTYNGNTTCVTSYNAERISKWANHILDEFYRKYPDQKIPDITSSNVGLNISDIITKSMDFTVIQGEIIRNESMSVTCCGVNGTTLLSRLITGKLRRTNCVHQNYVIPLKKLTFERVTSRAERKASNGSSGSTPYGDISYPDNTWLQETLARMPNILITDSTDMDDNGIAYSNEGNASCISILNTTALTEWHKKHVETFKKKFPNSTFPLYIFGNYTADEKFKIEPGRIIHREPVTIICCGSQKNTKNINQHQNVNCHTQMAYIPLRKLMFSRIEELSTTESGEWYEIDKTNNTEN